MRKCSQVFLILHYTSLVPSFAVQVYLRTRPSYTWRLYSRLDLPCAFTFRALNTHQYEFAACVGARVVLWRCVGGPPHLRQPWVYKEGVCFYRWWRFVLHLAAFIPISFGHARLMIEISAAKPQLIFEIPSYQTAPSSWWTPLFVDQLGMHSLELLPEEILLQSWAGKSQLQWRVDSCSCRPLWLAASKGHYWCM